MSVSSIIAPKMYGIDPIDSTGAMLPVSAGHFTRRHRPLQETARWRKRSRPHETRRFFLDREEEPGRHGRLEVRRHARNLATLLVSRRSLGRGHVQGGFGV